MFLFKYTHKTKEPWNKGKIIGQKQPLKLKEIWSIRFQLQMAKKSRELALFNLKLHNKQENHYQIGSITLT